MKDDKRKECEQRLTAIENEAAEIKKALAELDEPEWVECSAGEALDYYLATGKPPQVFGCARWSNAIPENMTFTSTKSYDKWRIPTSLRRKRVVLEGRVSSFLGKCIVRRDDTGPSLNDQISRAINDWENGTPLRITIEEAD